MTTMTRVPRVLVRRMREQFRIRRGIFFHAHGHPPAALVPAGYTVTELSAADVIGDPAIVARSRAERFGERHAAGHRAFGFRTADGTLAAYFWCTVGMRVPAVVPWEFGSTLMIPASTAYIWDCYTLEAHRQRGLYTSGLRMLRAFGAYAGCARAIIVVAVSNVPSIAGIVAAGFRPLGGCTMVRIGSATMLRTVGHGTSFRRDGDPHPFPFTGDAR